MKRLNINQKKVITDLLVNLLVAWISISVFNRLLDRNVTLFDINMIVITIFITVPTIISLVNMLKS